MDFNTGMKMTIGVVLSFFISSGISNVFQGREILSFEEETIIANK